MRLKSQLYFNEQDDIINKIINILGITETKNTITLYEIDNNDFMKQQLMELIPEIRKWFSFAHINPISNPESTWNKFMLSEKDILDLHEFIVDTGYSKNVPTKAELQAILKHNLILYTKTDDGKFVPVWKAD